MTLIESSIPTTTLTLTAGVVEAVGFERDPSAVQIISDGAAEIVLTVYGEDVVDPTWKGHHTIPAAPCRLVLPTQRLPTLIKLLSEGTPEVSISQAPGRLGGSELWFL